MTEEEMRMMQLQGQLPPIPPGGLYSAPPVLPVPAGLIQPQMQQAGQIPQGAPGGQPEARGLKRFGQNLGNMFGIGPDSEQYRAQGMIDPRAAAWSQGLQNIVQMNMGQAPTNDPFSAYQRQVMANTTTRLSEEQERRRAERETR